MNPIIEKLAECVEFGKFDKSSPYPPQMKDQDGADELAQQALAENVDPNEILEGCMVGMQKIGEKFSKNEAFVPELLMSAKAMTQVMTHLKPFFQSGSVQRKGTFIIGTVAGDLHDIGKRLVAMVIEGNGWEVVDLGVDISAEKFLNAIAEHPNSVVGMSALLTTTMANMENTVKEIKAKYPDIKVMVGGAPVTEDFATKIGADGYASDPQKAVSWLAKEAA